MPDYLLVPDPHAAAQPDAAPASAFQELVRRQWPQARFPDPVPPALLACAWIPDPSDNWLDLVIDLHPGGRSLGISCSSRDLVQEAADWWARVRFPDGRMWLFDASGTGYDVIGDPAAGPG